MNVSVERVVNEATIKIQLPAAEVNKGFAKAVQKIAGQVNIPSFRKGKAPRHILELHVGKEAIKQEAFEMVANDCFRKAMADEKLIPVSDPSVKESTFEENADMELVLTITVKPEPKLGEYKGLTVEKKEAVVTEEQIDDAVEELRKRGAKMVVAPDAVIMKGDFAIIDFAGTVDGEAFSGGEGKGYPLEVGSGSFIPGFEEQLVGLKAGDSTDVNVTFPDEYFVKELAGKEAIFKVNVQDVKRKELPELTDEFVAANSKCKTVDELKADFMARRNSHPSGIKRIGIAALVCIILLGFISYPLLYQQEKSISITPAHHEAKKDTVIRQQTKKPAPLSNGRKSLQPTATEPSSASHLQSAELISKGKKTIDKMWKESGIDTIQSVVKKSEAFYQFVNKSNEFISTTYPQTFSKDIAGKADIIYELSSYNAERYIRPTLSSFQSSK